MDVDRIDLDRRYAATDQASALFVICVYRRSRSSAVIIFESERPAM
jgi:hypothetical protein